MKRFLRLILCGVLLSGAMAATASGQIPGFDGGGFMPFSAALNSPYPMRFWVSGTAANSGLGYEGSYFTAGTKGLIGEDAIGGRWLLEARGHVTADKGQLLGNIGAERMYYLEPAKADLGIGVWFDVDADQEEIFGHTFNEVGVSGVIKTENFDVRGNGYFPIGNRENLLGAPGECFFQNRIVLQRGIDVALTGFDAEVRLRLPEMQMFAGTLDIGGYYYGADSIESFGGFRARLGVQTLSGVAFNVELDHDERYQSTGYLQLVFNFGGSAEYSPLGRDLEPTVRNDHIVRVHQDPIFATNPTTGALWRVIHVDNTNAIAGDGTFENPFRALTSAETTSVEDDIIFVHLGDGTSNFMDEGIVLKDRQRFLGDGVLHVVPTVEVGDFELCNDQNGLRPTISNPFGAAVTLADDNIVSGFIIEDAQTGIFGGSNVTVADVNRNLITGGLHGIRLVDSDGDYEFTNNVIEDTTGRAFDILGVLGTPDTIVDWFGTIDNNVVSQQIIRIQNIGAGSQLSFTGTIDDNLGSGILIDNFSGTAVVTAPTNLTNSQAEGISILNSDGTIRFETTNIVNSTDTGVQLINNDGATITFEDLDITNAAAEGYVAFNNDGALLQVFGNNSIDVTGGVALSVTGVGDTTIDMTFNNVSSTLSPDRGVSLSNAQGSLFIDVLDISESANDSLAIQDSDGIVALFRVVNITGSGVPAVSFGNGVFLEDNPTSDFFFDVLNISTDNGGGLIASDSGTVTVNSGTIAAIGGPAIAIDPTIIDLTFQDVSSTDSVSDGILLNDARGTLLVTGATTIDGAQGVGINAFGNTNGLSADFGATTIQAATGINLVNNGTANFIFNNLNVATAGGAGIFANDGGIVRLNGANPIINAAGGPGIDLTNTTGVTNGISGWTFANVSSTGSTSDGIRLADMPNLVVVNGGTLTGVTNDGIHVENNATGVTTRARFFGMTIDTVNGDAIDVSSSDGTVRVLLDGSSITAAGSAGMRASASGTGTTHFTATNNAVVSTGNSLDADVHAAGATVRLSIFGTNDGAGAAPATPFDLNQSAGTLGVAQANAAGLAADNPNVTTPVVVNTTGTITFNLGATLP